VTAAATGADTTTTAAGSASPLRRAPLVAALFLGALLLAAVAAPVLAPHAMDAVDLADRRAAPSLAHWFGTDELGRDVLTRVMFGARVSLAIGLLSALASVAFGVAVGATAGFAGRRVDDLLMRFTDAVLAIPRLPLLMLAAAVLQPGVPALILLVAAVGWMETARVARAEVKALAARDFVPAARAIGATPLRVLLRHVLPGVVPAASVATTLAIGRGILLESTMSFFGVGVQPPAASWGNMLYQAQTTMTSEPWLAIFPGVCILLTVLACNAVGDVLSPFDTDRPAS
jgi:peptide/nickel transport system permease protein